MSIKILIDMNLSPDWTPMQDFLEESSGINGPPDTQAEVNPSVQHKDPVKKESQQGCRKVKARPVLQYLR